MPVAMDRIVSQRWMLAFCDENSTAGSAQIDAHLNVVALLANYFGPKLAVEGHQIDTLHIFPAAVQERNGVAGLCKYRELGARQDATNTPPLQFRSDGHRIDCDGVPGKAGIMEAQAAGDRLVLLSQHQNVSVWTGHALAERFLVVAQLIRESGL